MSTIYQTILSVFLLVIAQFIKIPFIDIEIRPAALAYTVLTIAYILFQIVSYFMNLREQSGIILARNKWMPLLIFISTLTISSTYIISLLSIDESENVITGGLSIVYLIMFLFVMTMGLYTLNIYMQTFTYIGEGQFNAVSLCFSINSMFMSPGYDRLLTEPIAFGLFITLICFSFILTKIIHKITIGHASPIQHHMKEEEDQYIPINILFCGFVPIQLTTIGGEIMHNYVRMFNIALSDEELFYCGIFANLVLWYMYCSYNFMENDLIEYLDEKKAFLLQDDNTIQLNRIFYLVAVKRYLTVFNCVVFLAIWHINSRFISLYSVEIFPILLLLSDIDSIYSSYLDDQVAKQIDQLSPVF